MDGDWLPDLSPDHPMLDEAVVRRMRAEVLLSPAFRVWFVQFDTAARDYLRRPDEATEAAYKRTRSWYLTALRKEVAAQRGYWWRRVARLIAHRVMWVIFMLEHPRTVLGMLRR